MRGCAVNSQSMKWVTTSGVHFVWGISRDVQTYRMWRHNVIVTREWARYTLLWFGCASGWNGSFCDHLMAPPDGVTLKWWTPHLHSSMINKLWSNTVMIHYRVYLEMIFKSKHCYDPFSSKFGNAIQEQTLLWYSCGYHRFCIFQINWRFKLITRHRFQGVMEVRRSTRGATYRKLGELRKELCIEKCLMGKDWRQVTREGMCARRRGGEEDRTRCGCVKRDARRADMRDEDWRMLAWDEGQWGKATESW